MAPIALAVLALLLLAPAAHAETWRRPVEGPLLRAYALGANPYARGQHRGVDLAAPPGSTARSACSGRVSFAGRVPRGGLTVSVRCGPLIATHQQLAAAVVRKGQNVVRGARLGTVGRSADPRTRRAHVHLGAREAATGRYVDPLTLTGGGRPVVPLVPPAVRTAPRPAPLGPAPLPARPRPAPVPARPRPAPARPPALVPGLPRPAPVPVGPRPAPVPAGPRPAPVPARPRAAPVPRAVPSPLARPIPFTPTPALARPSASAPTTTVPWLVWVGLACVAIALPAGGLMTFRRRRRAAPRHAVATAR